MEKLLLPSMMCADFSDLKSEVKRLDEAGVDSFHCDVMDGVFVPNMTMGTLAIKAIRDLTKTMVDVHLMVENPSAVVDLYIDLGVDLIYIHPEAERYVVKTLQHLKNHGVKAGLVVNPDTAFETVREMLFLADYVMLMTVSPGFAGQDFLGFTKAKIETFIENKENYNYKLVIDGACSESVIKEYSNMGVDGFVLGTSALFKGLKNVEKYRRKGENYENCIRL